MPAHDTVIAVTVEGGWHSNTGGLGEGMRIRISDAANRCTMLELDLPESVVLDLLRNRSRLHDSEARLRVIGKGLDAHGLILQHGQLRVRVAGYGQPFLDAVLAELDQVPAFAGWNPDRRFNGHRLSRRPEERGPDGSEVYSIWMRRLVSPQELADWPDDLLAGIDGVVSWTLGDARE